jgi:hypothetical protein
VRACCWTIDTRTAVCNYPGSHEETGSALCHGGCEHRSPVDAGLENVFVQCSSKFRGIDRRSRFENVGRGRDRTVRACRRLDALCHI